MAAITPILVLSFCSPSNTSFFNYPPFYIQACPGEETSTDNVLMAGTIYYAGRRFVRSTQIHNDNDFQVVKYKG